ncbi:VCBS repeat-containing protein [Bradyrhizobium sp. 21]|nr:VCBS repeat-containing protein [Bradyrhizobium sp. 21]
MSLPGGFGVSPMGAATYSLPIAVPPGTAGMMPSLSLDYSSQGGNGFLGIGWTLSGLPSIARCPRTTAQDGSGGRVNDDANDRFCLEGQRLVAVSGAYGADGSEYRTEVETFSRVIAHGNSGAGPIWFEVRTKSGQIIQIGNSADSRISAQGKSAVRTWYVNKVSDIKANYFKITYTNDAANGLAYPSRIDYTANDSAGLAAYNSVQFVYASRPDAVPVYAAGLLVRPAVRLTNVQTYAGSTLISDYQLTYQQSSATNRSQLSSVKACAGGACLPSTNFAWSSSDNAQFNSHTSAFVSGNWSGFTFATADVNGDGKADILAYFIGTSGWSVAISLAQGNGAFAAPTLWSTTGNWSGFTFFTGDVNGDGKDDLIANYIGVNGWSVATALSTGTGFSAVSASASAGNWSGFSAAVGDVDSDGRADVVASYVDVNGWSVGFRHSVGDGTLAAPTASFTSGNWSGFTFSAADVNGDGRPDLIASYIGVNGWSVAVKLANGDGTFAVPVLWSLTGNWSGFSFSTADINGDGRADLVASYIGVNGWSVAFAVSRGDGGFASANTWFSAGNWSGFTFAVADVNGDGAADLIASYIGVNGWTFDVALSRADGTFAAIAPWNITGNWSGFAVTIADTSGKGRKDVIGYYVGVNGWSTVTQLSSALPMTLSSVTSGLGASTAISYLPLTDSSAYAKDATAVYPQMDVQAPLYVVSRVDSSNGLGGNYSSSYIYAGAKTDLSGRGFLGFRQTTIKDLQTNIVDTTNYRQDFPHIGLVASTTRAVGPQTLGQSSNTYQFGNASGAGSVTAASVTAAPYRVWLTQNVSGGADLDGSSLPTVTTSNQYDAYLNATQVVVSTPDGFSKTSNSTYANDPTNWYLGRLTRATVTNVAP